MSADVPDNQPPRDQEFVRWLRALADAVEQDPALAERVRHEAGEPAAPAENANDDAVGTLFIAPLSPPIAPNHSPSDPAEDEGNHVARDEGNHKGLPLHTVGQDVITDAADKLPPGDIAPTLRHTRRSSRYGPPSISGRAAELGTGVPDPFALLATTGEDGLRRALETLRVGSLRAIIRAHGLDPQGKLSAGATEKRLITAIVAAAKRAMGNAQIDGKPTRKTAKRTKKTRA
jgi:hypothetical protein